MSTWRRPTRRSSRPSYWGEIRRALAELGEGHFSALANPSEEERRAVAIAFLLGQPRSADVYAATDGVRVLSLSESTSRDMIASDPNVAARLLLNIAKILCLRVLKSG